MAASTRSAALATRSSPRPATWSRTARRPRSKGPRRRRRSLAPPRIGTSRINARCWSRPTRRREPLPCCPTTHRTTRRLDSTSSSTRSLARPSRTRRNSARCFDSRSKPTRSSARNCRYGKAEDQVDRGSTRAAPRADVRSRGPPPHPRDTKRNGDRSARLADRCRRAVARRRNRAHALVGSRPTEVGTRRQDN